MLGGFRRVCVFGVEILLPWAWDSTVLRFQRTGDLKSSWVTTRKELRTGLAGEKPSD